MTPSLQIVWNQFEGIDLGFFVIRYYSLMFVIAFALGWYLMKRIFDEEHESIEKLDSLFIWTVLSTLLGARLGQVFFYQWDHFKQHPAEILLPFRFDPFEFTGFQGLASHGAAIAIIIAMYFFSKRVMKRPLLWVLDRVSITVAIGAAFVRIGNFFNSEIVGTKTDSPLGVRFVRDQFLPEEASRITGIADHNEAYQAIQHNPLFAEYFQQVYPKHPAQLYEAACYTVIFAILFYLYWKTSIRERLGYLFGLYMVLLWSVRFAVEYVKESQGGFETALGDDLSTGQWLSIPFILVGLYLMWSAEKPIEGVDEI